MSWKYAALVVVTGFIFFTLGRVAPKSEVRFEVDELGALRSVMNVSQLELYEHFLDPRCSESYWKDRVTLLLSRFERAAEKIDEVQRESNNFRFSQSELESELAEILSRMSKIESLTSSTVESESCAVFVKETIERAE